MKLTITATGTITQVNGSLCRVWHGVAENGVQCLVFVSCLAVPDGQDARQFEDELAAMLPPVEAPCEVVQEPAARVILFSDN